MEMRVPSGCQLTFTEFSQPIEVVPAMNRLITSVATRRGVPPFVSTTYTSRGPVRMAGPVNMTSWPVW